MNSGDITVSRTFHANLGATSASELVGEKSDTRHDHKRNQARQSSIATTASSTEEDAPIIAVPVAIQFVQTDRCHPSEEEGNRDPFVSRSLAAFARIHFWPKLKIVRPRRVGAPKGGEPNPEKVGPRKSGAQKGGGPEGWAPNGRPKNFRFFFPLPPHFRSFCFFGGPKPPGLHTSAREPKRAHVRVPVFTKTTKIQRRHPERDRKSKNGAGEGNKKSEILGGPAQGGPEGLGEGSPKNGQNSIT